MAGEVVRAKGTHFTILIADLDGDNDRQQTRHVRAALLGRPGLEVHLTGQLLQVADLGSQTEAQIEAERRGRKLLEEGNGDLLIWGEVRATDKELNLWFLSRGGTSTFGAPSYSLTEKLSLPADFNQDLAAKLELLALASLAFPTEQEGRYLVGLLRGPAEKIERLLDRSVPGFEAGQIAGLEVAFGNAATFIGQQSGDSTWLEKAIDAYRAALQERTRERVPLQWATIQNNLGKTLSILGERERGTACLEEAMAAYRDALKEWTRERVPLQWAMTQNNLGNVLSILGERECAFR